MEAVVAGVGAWGPGFSNLAEFHALLSSGEKPPVEDVLPRPERIASRERRRAPLMVKLAIEVADQACRMAQVNPASAQSVFTSGIGDADITDYMCRILAGPDKLLSPTRFHNSVHNAAAGYWSIGTACVKPATFVSSMHNSFSLALVEALVQVTSDCVPVLLVLSDLAMPEPLRIMHPIERMFGVGILLVPVTTELPGCGPERTLSLCLQAASTNKVQEMAQWPTLGISHLEALYQASPAARSLCFLKALCSDSAWRAHLPVSDALLANVSLEQAREASPTFIQLRG